MKLRSGLVLLALLPCALPAQTYRWVDEAGQVHYTQIPPKSGPYSVIGPAPPPGAAPNQEALNQSLEESIKAEPEQQAAAEAAAQQQAQRQENCRQALVRLAYLDARTARRLGTTDAQGNIARMTEEEFQAQRAAEQDKIKQNCD